MGNRSSTELALCFLIIVISCLQADVIERIIYLPDKMMNWTAGRSYCQANYIDLVTWQTVKKLDMAQWLMGLGVTQVWIGLHRDQKNDSLWKWINLQTGEGLTGEDLSLSSDWASEQQSRHCAFAEASVWYSDLCSNKHGTYCSHESNIQYNEGQQNWNSALKFCQVTNKKLVTITEATTNNLESTGWIGLYRDGGDNWKWTGSTQSEYRKWAPKQPLNSDCGYFNPYTTKWYSNVCSNELQFVCYDDNLVLVKENKTWEEALMYCKDLKESCVDNTGPCNYTYNLLSIGSLTDYSYVRDRISSATTDEVWTGLRFLAGTWWWVNGAELDSQEMLSRCPSQQNHCGTLSKSSTDKWISRDCTEKRNFVCYRKTNFL